MNNQAMEETDHGEKGIISSKPKGNIQRKFVTTVLGDKIDQFGMEPGDEVNLGIEIESREYNGRWYTDVKAWKVDNQGSNGSNENHAASKIPDISTFYDDSGEDTLPF